MTGDTADNRKTQAQQRIADQNRHSEMNILAPKLAAPRKKVWQTEVQIHILHCEESENHHELKETGQNSTDRSTVQPQRRSTSVTCIAIAEVSFSAFMSLCPQNWEERTMAPEPRPMQMNWKIM